MLLKRYDLYQVCGALLELKVSGLIWGYAEQWSGLIFTLVSCLSRGAYELRKKR